MNTNFDMAYLSGGDDFFGPDYGGATVYTNVRAGYLEGMPERRQALVKNLEFTLDMENEIMGKILDDGMEARRPPTKWLKANPDALGPWLDGVTTEDGGEAGARRRQGEPRH